MKYFTKILFFLSALVINQTVSAQCTIVCNDFLQVSLDENGEANIVPDMILEGDYTGCNVDFVVSVIDNSGNDIEGPGVSVLVSCEDIGEIIIKVTDQNSGNACWTTIIIEDKVNMCDFGGNAIVVQAGLCSTYDFILNESETLTPFNDCIDILPELQAGTNTLSIGQDQSGSLNGVSTLDLVLMIRGVVLDMFTPIQAILTDVDNDGSVSSRDILTTRLIILGLILDFGDFGDVRVIRTDADFTNFDPYEFDNIYNTVQFEDTEFNTTNKISLYVYHVADLNESALGLKQDDDVEKRSTSEIVFQDQFITAGNTYSIELNIAHSDLINAFMAGFDVSNAVIESVGSETNGSDFMSNVIDNQVLISYLSLLGKESVNFTIDITPNQNGFMSNFIKMNSVLSNDLVSNDLDVSNVKLRAGEKIGTSSTAIFPNPANESTTILFDDQYKSLTKEIEIYNMNGELLRSLQTTDSSYSLSRDNSFSPGLYVVQIKVADELNRMKLVFN